MKECKCGKIPPCYGSLEFAIYEEAKKVNDEWKKSRALHGKLIDKLRAKLMEGGFADDTHDKVYELNRQMCDIDKHLSEAGYFGMICEGQVEARKKLKDMKEKKTKKMTKAEAFEYLKGKRVACDNFNCVAIQHKFFDVGIKWRGGSTKATDERGSFIFVDLNGYLTHCNSRTWFDTHEYEEISADDILSIEIVDGEDNIAEKNAFQQARDIMKWLREEQSPHTLMIIDGYHVELLDGVKAEVWKE